MRIWPLLHHTGEGEELGWGINFRAPNTRQAWFIGFRLPPLGSLFFRPGTVYTSSLSSEGRYETYRYEWASWEVYVYFGYKRKKYQHEKYG